MYPNYKLRSELCYAAIVLLLFIAGGLYGKTLSLESDISHLEDEIEYIENMEQPSSTVVEEYHEIDSMNGSEIQKYLEDLYDTTLYPFEEVYDVYILGFQRGYQARKKGLWNDTIEEYVDGYYFSESDPLFSKFK